MKFLCVECDQQMSLSETTMHREIGSLSAVFSCPSCGRRTAMLTNPVETQMVTSLGVKIGPGKESSTVSHSAAQSAAVSADMSKCPFSAMMKKMEGAIEPAASGDAARILWSEGAAERLNKIPDFIRSMARSGIESFARERGYSRIDESVLDEARAAIGW